MVIDDGQVTVLLRSLAEGDPERSERLMGLIYDDLHRIAASRVRGADRRSTVQATALIGEFWKKILEQMRAKKELPVWQSRGHFFKWSSIVMQNCLRDAARKKMAQKAGGGHTRVSLEGAEFVHDSEHPSVVLEIMDAVDVLAEIDEEVGGTVRLRLFCGLNCGEIAAVLGLSESQAERRLQAARAWLRDRFAE